MIYSILYSILHPATSSRKALTGHEVVLLLLNRIIFRLIVRNNLWLYCANPKKNIILIKSMYDII